MRKFFKYAFYRLTYVMALFLSVLGMQAPTLSNAKEIATSIFVMLFIPSFIQMLTGFWKLIPLGSKVYRNHPQWGRAKDEDY